MIIGFIGAGSMAAAMARGWADMGDTMLFSDSGSGRAAALAAEVGGEALPNSEVAARADFVVLAVKPAKLEEAAAELAAAKRVVSVLAAVPVPRLREALPGAGEVLRVMPNVGVAVGRGVLCAAGEASPEVRAKLEQLGLVVDLPDERFDAATAVMGCSPAYFALAAEALIDAGAAAGLGPELARRLVVETAAGTAELLREQDPSAVQKAVASPGGSTEAGLEALDREGARGAFAAAVSDSLDRMAGRR
jgi:pyrroline-5-carboxylate reductase